MLRITRKKLQWESPEITDRVTLFGIGMPGRDSNNNYSEQRHTCVYTITAER